MKSKVKSKVSETKKVGVGLSEIKKFKVLSVANVLLVMVLIFCLIYGINISLAEKQTLMINPELDSMSFADEQDAGNPQAVLGLALIKLGYWNIIVMPIALAILYFLGGALIALIYNLIARYIGGIKAVLN